MPILSSSPYTLNIESEFLDFQQNLEIFNKSCKMKGFFFDALSTATELSFKVRKKTSVPLQLIENGSFFSSQDTSQTAVYYQNIVGLDLRGRQFVRTLQISPHIVGEYVQLSFPLGDDQWEDENGWLYFKPLGQTIGNVGSGAKYSREDLKILFLRMWSNTFLQLYDFNGVEVARATNAQDDWNGNRRIAIPKHPGARFVTPGQANINETEWQVGEVKGRERYEVPLRKHGHQFNQQPHQHTVTQVQHTHGITQLPHDHALNQQPHQHEIPIVVEGSSDDFGGRDFSNSGTTNFNTSPSLVPLSLESNTINIQVRPENVNINLQSSTIAASVEETGLEGDFSLVTPSVCAEFVIFSGVIADPSTPLN